MASLALSPASPLLSDALFQVLQSSNVDYSSSSCSISSSEAVKNHIGLLEKPNAAIPGEDPTERMRPATSATLTAIDRVNI
jgi:hypothetical protein